MVMRLDKLLAHYGIGTRKEVKNYIRKGFVTVNGSIIKKDDFKVDYETDKIIFDGELITYKPYVYIMLNKPAGYVSATKDNVHPTVVDLIYGYEQYDLFPVGRLDLDTEGLLLLTNDGDFAHKLLAPSRHHSKLYYACVEGIMDENDILKFKEGITIDHYRCQSSNLSIIKTEDNTSEVLIEIFEGKFHQVKKMVESVGKKVTYLKWLQMKNLKLMHFDAIELENVFENGEIDHLFLNFSDPWPKKRHAKRRLTSSAFLNVYRRLLKKDGVIEFKTDNRGLFEYSLQSVTENNYHLDYVSLDLHNSPEADDNIMTEYERKFSVNGPIYKMIISDCKE